MQSAGNKRMYWDFWDILEIERMAHQKGFEPLTDRFVADYSIQLSYWCVMKKKRNGAPEGIRTPDRSVRSRLLYPAELLVRDEEKKEMAHQKGFEPLTDRFVADYSIQLSYWCVHLFSYGAKF